MATSTAKKSSAKKRSPVYPDAENIFHYLSQGERREVDYAKPEEGLEKRIDDIYEQAANHRSLLLKFYLLYMILFSLCVMALVFFQVQVRIIPGNETVEIVPQWVLYLLAVGMFSQFIGLLTIVTTKVWSFEPFLRHKPRDSKHQD